MKKLTAFTICLLALVASAMAVTYPAELGFSTFSTPGTALNAGTNYVIIPSQSRSGGDPLITYINATTTFASGSTALTQYISTNQTTEASGLTNSTTTIYVTSTNGFAPNQWVVIQHTVQFNNMPRFQNEAAIISLVQNTNQIVLFTAPVNAVLPGDTINQETAWATIPFLTSATPREISNGTGVLSGQRSEPNLLTLVGTAAGTNTFNTVTVGSFVP